MSSPDGRLLDFARSLHTLETFEEMVEATARAIREEAGYLHTWVGVFDLERGVARMLAFHGDAEKAQFSPEVTFPIEGDPLLVRILDTGQTDVVPDAQTSSRVRREVVQQLGNRTIINVPMRLVDQPFGVLGTGTFGEEGVLEPTPAQLAYLEGLAHQLVTATARATLAEERKAQRARDAELDRKLQRRQQLESLGQLAGGVAHDFNNLLTVVLASASLLAEGEDDAQRRADIDTIVEATWRAGELTKRLLALGKRQSLALTSIDLAAVVRSLVDMVQRVIPANITFCVRSEDALPSIVADAGQLEQVVLNLCINARDAMPEGGRLSIDVEPVVLNDAFAREHPWAKTGHYVLLTVTDTGTGMPPEVLDRIFEPFFTTKGPTEGTGLGLAVSRGIVEQHGGLLHVYSEVGVGTTFKIYLPVSSGDAAATEKSQELAVPRAREGERVLVADDQSAVRHVVARILSGAGYEVEVARDGVEAVALAQASSFHLAILDAVMPNMAGRQAFDQLRTIAPDLPILFSSGYGAQELSTRFLSDTEAPVLPKPFDPDTLLRHVRALIDAGR